MILFFTGFFLSIPLALPIGLVLLSKHAFSVSAVE